ncbi:type II toxin-antitoxin system HicA family toxin [Candidatus Igneacidithiobacillus taiwanensis]|uniref:type II toxin-antitoxin system HicA family toxin n=1 Tax=Candidatus Igneacidithiobacillus taiwanensis TaxID=1945924 RepID=UPI00289979EC|nr:type II toxin-antitoxin system HicA family toxin [Candidatus Igneacidithiobacillus taiwanensis]
MNSKHRKTLEQIFASPTPHLSIKWQDIERLLIACGAQVLEADGSAIRIILGGRRAFLHRPHPQKEAKAYQVKAVKELLESAGIKP